MRKNQNFWPVEKKDKQNESYCQGRTIPAVDDTNNNGLLLGNKNRTLVLLLTFFLYY